jgi:hypothetical protein
MVVSLRLHCKNIYGRPAFYLPYVDKAGCGFRLTSHSYQLIQPILQRYINWRNGMDIESERYRQELYRN